MGLECSGYLVDKESGNVTGKRVMALLSGGGYAEYAKVHRNHIMPIPNSLDFIQVSINLKIVFCYSRGLDNSLSTNF